MAEYKLGRIRFIWKDNWTAGRTYYKDDIVRNGGKTYLCVVGHVADTNFYDDLERSPTYWNQVSDGTDWKGNWTISTYYKVNDIVKYGGRLYLCKTAHTSSSSSTSGTSPDTTAGLEADQAKWDLYATTLDWKGSWATNTRYKNNDVVRYGGITYICNTGHQSSTTANTDSDGLEADLAKWDVYATGFDWIGNWSTSYRYKKNDVVLYGGTTYVCKTGHLSAATATLGLESDQGLWEYFHKGIVFLGTWNPTSYRYKVNDVVKYGSSLWICVTDHTSATLFAEEKWSLFVGGLEYENSWSSATVYQPGDVVSYGGYAFISTTNHTNKVPTENPSDWDLFTTGFNFRGDWAIATEYKVGDVLRLHGYTYVVLLDHLSDNSNIPPNLVYWSRLNSGIKWAATAQSFVNVSGTNISGNGTGATFDISLANTTYTTVVHTGSAGTDYQVGDQITISGNNVGGISPANDITLTVTGIVGATPTGAISTVSSEGVSVTWKSGVDYVLGDAVLFGITSYICILEHSSSFDLRPDNDTSGQYWNVLAVGSTTSILTTQGDTLYYGGNGPTRLPIGTDGQVLRVNGNVPSWEYFGVIKNVVYVAPSGADVSGNGQGLTIDKPWKTVRYAARQIEDGYLNTNSVELLRRNKQFIINELYNYVKNTFKASITSATTTLFTCDSTENLYVGMPISFTDTVGGVVAGTTYYVFDIPDSTTFGITNTISGSRRALSAGAGTMTGTFVYSQTSTEHDAGIVVDAIAYDIGHSGTYQTTQATLAYFNTAGTSYVTGVYDYDIPAFVSTLDYLKVLAANVVNNQAPAVNYQSLSGISITDQALQDIDVSLTPDANVSNTISSLVSIVTTGLAAGTTSAIPAVINPGTTISVKTGTYTEVLPIVVPRNTAVVGDELRSSVIQPAAPNANLANDKLKTISVLERVKTLLPDLISNIGVTPTDGNTVPQAYLNGFIGSATARSRVDSFSSVMSAILEGGLLAANALEPVLTDPVGYDTGYYNARTLIVANKEFLKAEVVAYLEYNFVDFDSNYTSETCERDVGLIIDAVCYDLVTGSNFASSVAGMAYYRIQSANVTNNQLLQTLAVIDYVKSATSAYVDGSLLAEFNAAFDNVYSILENGLSAVPTYTWPSNGSTTTETIADAAALQTNRATLVTGVETYLSSTAPYDTVWAGLSTDQKNACKRDVGYIVDAISYDIQYGGTYQSVVAGSAYYSFGVLEIAGGEVAATLAALTQLSTLMKSYTSANGDTRVDELIASISDIINSGVIPSATYPAVTGESIVVQSSYAALQGSKATIPGDVTQYISDTFSSLTYDQAKCERDIGYIVDALEYDLTYGGNLETIVAARSYFSKGVFVEPSAEKIAAIAVQGRLQAIITDIAQGIAITKSSGNVAVQDTTAPVGSLAAGEFAAARINEIKNTITTGNLPVAVLPSLTWVSSDLVEANNVVQAKKSAIQSGAIAAIVYKYPNLVFDQALCSRDVGYIVDALCYDFMFNSNLRSKKAAMSYFRALTSTELVVAEQLDPTLFVVDYIANTINHLVTGVTGSVGNENAIVSVVNSTETIRTLVANGINDVPDFTFTNPTGYNTTFLAGYGDAKAQLVQNYQFLKDEISAYLNTTAPYDAVWSGLSVDQKNACTRDVGYILDALQYDMTYGGNYQTLIAGSAYYSFGVLTISQTEKAAAIAAYTRLKEVIDYVINENTSWTKSTGNVTAQDTSGTPGSSESVTFAQARIQEIISWITDEESPTAQEPSAYAIASAESKGSYDALIAAKAEIQADTVAWVNKFYQEVNFNSATCSRDAGLTVEAIALDLLFGTNFNSIKAGMSYYRVPASVVIAQQKAAELGALNFIEQKAKRIAANGAATQMHIAIDDMISSILGRFVLEANGTAAGGIVTLTTPGSMLYPGMPITFSDPLGDIVANKKYWILEILEDTSRIVITDTYGSIVPATFGTATGTVEAIAGGDLEVCGTNTYSNILSHVNGAEIIRANKTFLANEATAWVEYTFAAAITATEQSTNRVTTTAPHGFKEGDPVIFAGTPFGNIIPNRVYYIYNVPTSNTFLLVSEAGSTDVVGLTDDSGVMTVKYSFDQEACKRDMGTYIDALVYDVNYLGNYKSLRAAELYVNAVDGSAESNMFLLRNSTGLRNMTLNGLSGTLTEVNAFGTKRVTAGAYASLDPGYGPTDSNVWISTRSPYVQNVTTFGTGCVGCKIDGALHVGGNRSIVSNDFTQILSDGIGVWCTGHNSLTELVSVFTYYNYAGYLAEKGGKIRATNGNNSYGVYGSLAEGVDTYEEPITATINNRYYQAQVTNVVTDSTDQVYRVEFKNAGTKYNTANISISGTGYNVETVTNEFRDNAVFETRVITNGEDYVSSASVAQGGSTTAITLAATDSAISAAYIGMRILLTGGSGVGQTGYIVKYNSGTKLATVAKESFSAPLVTSAGSNLLTVASTDGLYDQMPVMFTGSVLTGCTLALQQAYYVVGASITETQFSVANSPGGSAISVGTGSTGGPMTVNALGWDHIVTGTAIASALDLTTSYIIEPRVLYTSPTYVDNALTQVSGTWSGLVYGDTSAVYNGVGSVGVAATGGSGTGATFTVTRTGVAYSIVTNNTGFNYRLGDVLTISGTLLGGTSTNNITITVNNVSDATGAIQNFVYDGTGSGGYFVAISASGTDAQISSDGITFTSSITMYNGNQVALAYGDGLWVTIPGSGTATNYTDSPADYWAAGGALPATSGTWAAICYGNGAFMAIASGATNAATTEDGVTWTATGALPASTTWSGVAYGNGVYVAIASGGTQAASSANGVTWTTRSLPTSADWSSVTFGKGVFVAVATGSKIAAYSKDGITWVLSTAGLPVSGSWSSVRYGQGVFVAIQSTSSTVIAYSENGSHWHRKAISSTTAKLIAFGNPNSVPVWSVITDSSTAGRSLTLGCTTQGRAKVSNGAISEIRIVEPGSSYSLAPTLTVVDPNRTSAASWQSRIGVGALANPTFTNRGAQYATAIAIIEGNGYADMYQDGYFINVASLPKNATSGANLQIAGNTNYYKLVQSSNFLGTNGGQSPYTARFQISPALTANDAPAHGAVVTLRLQYSQVRLTGHDFLSIGTGNVVTTNYPNTPTQPADPTKETVGNNGGRVFYTSTDQDGNFRVGTLFSVEQATGVASINADAFNLAGLNSLTLGSVALGGSGATITQFSTDQYFSANSDNIVPTQKAIKAYISNQIGGGSSALNVNTLTAGVIYIAGNNISTTTGVQINVTATMNFTGGINGVPVAMDFLLLG